jgi:hypothetical protein
MGWQLLGWLGIVFAGVLLIVVVVRRVRAWRGARRAGEKVYTPPKVFPRPKPPRASDRQL